MLIGNMDMKRFQPIIMLQFLILMIVSFNKSTVQIEIEPRQTSLKNYFAKLKFSMFSYTFRMFSQQFSTSFIFNESCFVFLFKVYINQGRIWKTLPTFKMELCMTIGIRKVICCRLMILYTQYCPMSVFICISSLLVPGGSICKHLRWCFL